MWIKKEEYERLRMAEYERDMLAKEVVDLRNKLAKSNDKPARRTLGMVHAEQQMFPLDEIE